MREILESKSILRKGNYFKKSFLYILFISSIPGLITGITIRFLVVNQVEDSLISSYQKQLETEERNIDKTIENLEMVVSHLSFQPIFIDDLDKIDLVKEYSTTYDLTKILIALEDSNPLIKKASLYLKGKSNIILDPEYNVIKNNNIKDQMEQFLFNGNSLKWIYQKEKNEYLSNLSLVQTIPATSSKPYGAIIMDIDLRKLLANTQYSDLSKYKSSFIFNEDNKLLAESSKENHDFYNHIIKQINQYNEDERSFVFSWKGDNYSVSYTKMDRLNSKLIYVSTSLFSTITKPINLISNIIMIVSLLCLILSFLMTWIGSKRIYTPIEKLIRLFKDIDDVYSEEDEVKFIEGKVQQLFKKNTDLQNKHIELTSQLINSFFIQLAQGFFSHYKEEELLKRLSSYGYDMTEKKYLIIGIQMINIESSKKENFDNDEILMGFIGQNIIKELSWNIFQESYLISSESIFIGLLIIFANEDSIDDKLHQFNQEVTNNVNNILQVQTIITIGKKIDALKDISQQLDEVKQGKNYRKFTYENQIIYLDKVENIDYFKETYYPFSLEKDIVQMIRLEQPEEEIKASITEFVSELINRVNKEIDIQFGLNLLLSAVQKEILKFGIHPYELYQKNIIKELSYELSRDQNIEYIVNWIMKNVIHPYIEKVDKLKKNEQKQLIEKVIEIINNDYMKYDLSLEGCAEKLGINPYTLSKAFKKVTGENFIDYLTEVRIDKAKELLLTTNKKIQEISINVGYQQSYFNRIFKKYTGFSPGQYRKKYEIKQRRIF